MLSKKQCLLLTLLDAMDAPVGHTDFQKLLLLYTREYEKQPSYEFVPYKFGGFSFTSYADKRRLIDGGFLENDDQLWRLTAAGRATARRQAVEPLRAATFCRRHADLSGDRLLSEAYRRQPYFAIRSEILDKVPLDAETRKRIEAARPQRQPPGIVTIGYEGRTLEGYLNELLRAAVTLLCDVRRNPLSRKYGFSKVTLSKACAGVGIRYEHLPELGIASEARRELKAQADYDALFAVYERESLPAQWEALEKIYNCVVGGERVALTCFERLPWQCHRHCVTQALEDAHGRRFSARHL